MMEGQGKNGGKVTFERDGEWVRFTWKRGDQERPVAVLADDLLEFVQEELSGPRRYLNDEGTGERQ